MLSLAAAVISMVPLASSMLIASMSFSPLFCLLESCLISLVGLEEDEAASSASSSVSSLLL
eukprot:1002913-Prorocentrum_lima.AAC.1